MAKTLIVFGSETGNTKAAAEMIAQVLESKGIATELRDVRGTGVGVFAEPFDLFLLGVSTWGAVEEEVQQDFEAFYEDMARTALNGKRVAVFGSGDKGYDRFAKAVDFVEQRLKQQGADLVSPSLKFHLHPKDSVDEVRVWAEKLASLA